MDYSNLISILMYINVDIVVTFFIGVVLLLLLCVTVIPPAWSEELSVFIIVVSIIVIIGTYYDSRSVLSYNVTTETIQSSSKYDTSMEYLLIDERYVRVRRNLETRYATDKELEYPIATVDIIKFKYKPRIYLDNKKLASELSKPYCVLRRLEY